MTMKTPAMRSRKPIVLPEHYTARQALAYFGLVSSPIPNSPMFNISDRDTGEIVGKCLWHFEWMKEEGYIK